MNEQTSGAEPAPVSTRKLVEQRRPGVRAVQPSADELTDTAPFATPAWVGPNRHSDRPTPSPGEYAARHRRPGLPEQPTPAHDQLGDATEPHLADIAPSTAPVPTAAEIPLQARWSGLRTGRRTLGALLVLAGAIAVVTGALAVTASSRDLFTVFAASALTTMAIWGLMGSMKPMTVELKGALLTVRHRNLTDTFDLSHPFQLVHLHGDVDSPDWALSLVREDGSEVVLTSRSVWPDELEPVVRFYRARAEERLRDRKRRFTL